MKDDMIIGMIIFTIFVVVFVIAVIFLTQYQNTIFNHMTNEKVIIKNMNCDQLWNEEASYFKINNYTGGFDVVREKYHNDCVSKTFGYSEPNEDQQDSYFLSLDCNSLKNYIKNQNLYYERAITDLKVMCKGQ